MPPPLVRIASRLPGNGSYAPERLGSGEQLVEIEHAQQAGAAERGVVDRVRAGERAGVGLRRLGTLRMTAGLDHHHRLDPCGGARRRHELARVVDRFDIKQDRTGAPVEREEVEQIAEIDVDLVAQRDDRRETDAVRRRPFDQARGDGAGLRDQREVAGRRHAGGEAGIELGARRQDAEAVRADEPQAGARAAFSQASASEPAPCPSPAVMMMAAAAPLSPAAATMAGTDCGGAAMTSRSGTSGRS